MSIAGTVIAATIILVLFRLPRRRAAATVAAFALAGATLLSVGGTASAADVADVGLGTAEDYSVLAASTVTNTGATTMQRNLGLHPGTAVTGWPPGQISAPGTAQVTTAAAELAQVDLANALVDAAGRDLDQTVAADLTDQLLSPGVYAGPAKGPLLLTGTVTLDAADDPDAVWIFQTDSTLTLASNSRVQLQNGAQACHVYWQVGSSATLGTGSVLRGNVLASTSVTVAQGATVDGRTLAHTGAVTLDDVTYVTSACVPGADTTTTTTTTIAGPTTGVPTTDPSPTTAPSTTSSPDTTAPSPTSPPTVTSPDTTSPDTTSPDTTSPGTTSPATTSPATTAPPVSNPTTTTPTSLFSVPPTSDDAPTPGPTPPASPETPAPAPSSPPGTPTSITGTPDQETPGDSTTTTAPDTSTTAPGTPTTAPVSEGPAPTTGGATPTTPDDRTVTEGQTETSTARPGVPAVSAPPRTGAAPAAPAAPRRLLTLGLTGLGLAGLVLLRRDRIQARR